MTPRDILLAAWKMTPCPRCIGFGIEDNDNMTPRRCRSCNARGHASIHEFANRLGRNRRLIGRYISGRLQVSAPVLKMCQDILAQHVTAVSTTSTATSERPQLAATPTTTP